MYFFIQGARFSTALHNVEKTTLFLCSGR